MYAYPESDKIGIGATSWLVMLVLSSLGIGSILLDFTRLAWGSADYALGGGLWINYPVSILVGLGVALASKPRLTKQLSNHNLPTRHNGIRIPQLAWFVLLFLSCVGFGTLIVDFFWLTGFNEDYAVRKGDWMKYPLSLLALFLDFAKRRL